MSRRSEYDAAYFTLLRAQEELGHLRRYQQFLEEELERLDEVTRQVDAASQVVPRKFRKMVDATDKQLLEAVGRRRAIVLAEQRKVPQRITEQEAFVAECEDEVSALRGG
jgi:DNA repair ATPase RecN